MKIKCIRNKENAIALNKWVCKVNNDENFAFLEDKAYFAYPEANYCSLDNFPKHILVSSEELLKITKNTYCEIY